MLTRPHVLIGWAGRTTIPLAGQCHDNHFDWRVAHSAAIRRTQEGVRGVVDPGHQNQGLAPGTVFHRRPNEPSKPQGPHRKNGPNPYPVLPRSRRWAANSCGDHAQGGSWPPMGSTWRTIFLSASAMHVVTSSICPKS